MKKILTAWGGLCRLILMTIIFFVAVAHARATGMISTPQEVLSQRVSIHLQGVSLEEALDKLGALVKVKFFYSPDHLKGARSISIAATDKPLRDILDELLKPLGIQYKVHEKQSAITLKKQKEPPTEQTVPARRSSVTEAQFFSVTGIVKETGTQSPMAGVNVVVKGTLNGTTTNADGKYAINVTSEHDVLVFSFIGYLPVEVVVNAQTVVDVQLVEDVNTLSEVLVNAGYWVVKEKENTGAISKVSAEEIEQQPVNNVLQSLEGRMTGVYISQNSGLPGSHVNVQIRGRNSIAAGNAPLYLVDGIPFSASSAASNFTSADLYGDGTSALSVLSPESIESIEVLKDADATAIYGSRGANGVVLITTKRGNKDRANVSFSISRGFSVAPRRMDLMSTPQYIAMRKEAFRNDGVVPDETLAPDLLLWDTTRYTDWQSKLVGGKSDFTNAMASVSGGSKETQFLFNNAFQSQGSVFPGDFRYLRGSSQLSISNTSFAGKLRTTASITYGIERNNTMAVDLMPTALTLAPNAPALYEDDGDLNWENSTWVNPLSYLQQRYRANTSNVIANAGVGYMIVRGLELKGTFSVNDFRFDDKSFSPSSSFNPAYGLTAADASAKFNTTAIKSWIVEPQLSYDWMSGRHEIAVLAGSTFQNTDREQLVQLGRGYSSDALIEDINAAAAVDVFSYANTRYRYAAVFGRVNYKFDHRYVLNVTARRDGSSRFGPANKFANFMAVGAAWIFSEEPWLRKRQSILSFGKLRASYGTTGNDQIDDYGYLDTYSSSNTYQGIPGLYPTRLYNPDYGWELNRKLEVGLETGLIEDRITLKVDYYSNRSSSQLMGYPLPLTTGYSAVRANLDAKVGNTGWEFDVAGEVVAKDNFRWTAKVLLTVPRNKLIEFPNLEATTYANMFVIGEPLNISKRYHLLGVNPETGVYDFEDMNGDGSLTAADKLAIVQQGQQYYGGLSNAFSYKGIHLEFFIQYVRQRGSNYQSLMSSYPGQRQQQSADVLDSRWQSRGDVSTYQRFSDADDAVATAQLRYQESDAVIGDASFMRLKNVSLSWQLPNAWTRSVQCRLYVQAQNLLTLTNYDGPDPETMSIVLPPLRTISGGVQINL